MLLELLLSLRLWHLTKRFLFFLGAHACVVQGEGLPDISGIRKRGFVLTKACCVATTWGFHGVGRISSLCLGGFDGKGAARPGTKGEG